MSGARYVSIVLEVSPDDELTSVDISADLPQVVGVQLAVSLIAAAMAQNGMPIRQANAAAVTLARAARMLSHEFVLGMHDDQP